MMAAIVTVTVVFVLHQIGNIVNLPADPDHAWALVQTLALDVILFPDWQPFPDQQVQFLPLYPQDGPTQ